MAGVIILSETTLKRGQSKDLAMVNRRIRALLFFFIILGMGGLAVAVMLMDRKENGMVVVESAGALKRLEKINLYGVDGKRKVWELFADRGVQKTEDVILLDNVKLIHHLDGRSHVLTGRRASYDRKQKEIEVEGDVKVVSSEGYTLLTGFLKYSLSRKKVFTDRPLRFLSDKMDVEGVGLEADLTASRIKVLKEVRTVLKDVFI